MKIFGLLLLLGSCASASRITGPDGTAHHLISCEMGIEHCYEKATEICHTYKIIDNSSETTGGAITTTTNKLLVKCEG